MKVLITVVLFLITAGCNQVTNSRITRVFNSEEVQFVIDTVVSNLKVPWSMDWLPDGRALITDRGVNENSIKILDNNGKLTSLCNIPVAYSKGDGGMLDILIHPDYPSNPYIYFAYAFLRSDSASTLKVERARLDGFCLQDRETLFQALPFVPLNGHLGGRLQLSKGYLFISKGERYHLRDSAQSLSNHLGKIIRIKEDGTVPEDNPFVNVSNALPEIWSYGHRNPQGMTLNPLTGALWIHEHGPQGGDEINIIEPGKNYGWPVITYGEEYGGGPIGEGITEKEGMEQPVYVYTPSIAPSGMTFYTGTKFQEWKGNLFLGALALTHLNRLVIKNDKVIHEERLLEEFKWRVRFVRQGPDELIYLGVDDGLIVRLRPYSSK